MDLPDLIKKLHELGRATQDAQIAKNNRETARIPDLKLRFMKKLEALVGSNSHVSLYRQLERLSPDGTKDVSVIEIADLCFYDHQADPPPSKSYYCQVFCALIDEESDGNTTIRKGDIKTITIKDRDDEEDSDDKPCGFLDTPPEDTDEQTTGGPDNLAALEKMWQIDR